MASSQFNLHETDTGWQNLTPPTGVTVNDNVYSYRKVGNQVTIIFDINVQTSPSTSTWNNLPSSITPTKTISQTIPPYYNTGIKAAMFLCTKNGTFDVYAATNGQRYSGVITYPV